MLRFQRVPERESKMWVQAACHMLEKPTDLQRPVLFTLQQLPLFALLRFVVGTLVLLALRNVRGKTANDMEWEF